MAKPPGAPREHVSLPPRRRGLRSLASCHRGPRMNQNRPAPRSCSICGRALPPRQLVARALVRGTTDDLIRAEHPEWSSESLICREDLARYRAQYVSKMLASERGELGAIEQQVLES